VDVWRCGGVRCKDSCWLNGYVGARCILRLHRLPSPPLNTPTLEHPNTSTPQHLNTPTPSPRALAHRACADAHTVGWRRGQGEGLSGVDGRKYARRCRGMHVVSIQGAFDEPISGPSSAPCRPDCLAPCFSPSPA
jgi:hypothetical protein